MEDGWVPKKLGIYSRVLANYLAKFSAVIDFCH